jgi:hypothetical protein
MYHVVKNLIIEDLDLGNKSVTSDIQNVLEAIHKDLEFIPETIIYRDSEGKYDRVEHEKGKFVRFFPVNETNLIDALRR